jgi:hypothetical protein
LGHAHRLLQANQLPVIAPSPQTNRLPRQCSRGSFLCTANIQAQTEMPHKKYRELFAQIKRDDAEHAQKLREQLQDLLG